MDKKITIPAGIALMVVLAVAGMLAIFSYTAATPVQAAITADSVTYMGTNNQIAGVGGATIGFTTDAEIAVDGEIVITWGSGFTVASSAADLGVVTVNGNAATAVGNGQAVTVTVVTAVPVGSVAVAIEKGITNHVDPAEYPITVSVDASVTTETGMFRVYAGSVSVIPNKPKKADDIVFKFTAAANISPESYIVLILQEKFQVPGTISASNVVISASTGADGSKRAADVIVDDAKVFKVDKDDPLIFIQVPDMDERDIDPSRGPTDIASGDVVTVTIAKAAGIRAPTEAKTYKVAAYLAGSGRAGRDDATDAIEYGVDTQAGMFILYHEQTLKRLVTLSGEDFGRGDEVVATAKGWGGSSISFFVDLNGDGELNEGNEATIPDCANVGNDDNVGECTFTVGNEFTGGHGSTNACNGTDAPTMPFGGTCNLINAFDSENAYSSINWEDDVLEVKASVSLSPAEGNPGDKIDVVIRDFPANTSVMEITLAGSTSPLCTGCGTTDSRGDANVEVTIPNVPLGPRFLEVTVGTVSEDTDLIVGGASVIATPTEVIPNQRVNLTGSGFSRSTSGTSVEIKTITIGGEPVDLPSTSEERKVDSGGTWSMAINIPLVRGTVDGGRQVLTVTDSMDRVGQTTLTFKERIVRVSPPEGKIDSTIVITGENFPGLNDDGFRNVRVTVSYGGDLESETEEPDVNGRWSTQITVPDNVSIPSTNSVKVSFPVGTGTESENFRHLVPAATISLSPAAGPEGGTVTLTGSGFNRFRPYFALTVGSIPLTVSPVPTTDRNGNISFSFQIPGIDSGSHNVVLKIGEVTASATVSVSDETGVVGAMTSEVAVALEPLLMAGTLDRVFYFNNMTKQWQWYIVDPAFAASNNLSQIVSGAPQWVLVTESTTVTLNNRVVSFTCADDNCWNLITFP